MSFSHKNKRGNILSFLLGVSFTYLQLHQRSAAAGIIPTICPAAAVVKQERQAEPCNCDAVLEAAMKKMAISPSATDDIVVSAKTGTKSKEKNFYSLGLKHGTDKVVGELKLPGCLKNNSTCVRPGCVREECRPW
jgi:hypothetical protein